MAPIEFTVLLKEWSERKTQHGKALVEERLWASAPAEMRRAMPKYKYLLFIGLPTSAYELENRMRLLKAPDALWERVEQDMALSTAVTLVTRARREKRTVESMLAEYDSWPVHKHLEGGKVTRRPRLSSMAGVRQLSGAKSRVLNDTRWGKLRAILADYVADSLAGAHDETRARLSLSMERDLKTLIDSWREQISHAQRRLAREVVPTGRREMLNACRVLLIEPPGPGKAPNLERARAQWRRLAKEYHPDKRGSDVTRAEFENVQAAWQAIRSYVDEFEQCKAKKGTDDGDANGDE